MQPLRARWHDGLSVGNATIDAQHEQILAQCEVLAELCAVDGGNSSADPAFTAAYEQLMTLARAHFATEEALLAAAAFADLESYHHEIGEFAYLANQIATTENFDKIELQRFLAMWWVGHLASTLKNKDPYRA
ncbi:hypothetical protein MASR1M60_07100 [Rhodocyclaceae bacterium]